MTNRIEADGGMTVDATMRLVAEGFLLTKEESQTLATEVRRLRDLEWRLESDRLGIKQELAISEAEVKRLRADNERQRETIRVMSESEGKLQARIAEFETQPVYARMAKANGELRAKLARVEALPAKWIDCARSLNDTRSPTNLVDCAEELEAALRGDQPIGP
jgi:chromosome segregation ATPase